MEEYLEWPVLVRPDHSVLALPIFPGRLQPSIVGRSELNFRVRDGNGWTLALINTNFCTAIHSNNPYYILLPPKGVVTRTGIEPMFAA